MSEKLDEKKPLTASNVKDLVLAAERFVRLATTSKRQRAQRSATVALRWVAEAELDALDPPIDPSTRRLVHRGLAVAREVLAAEVR